MRLWGMAAIVLVACSDSGPEAGGGEGGEAGALNGPGGMGGSEAGAPVDGGMGGEGGVGGGACECEPGLARTCETECGTTGSETCAADCMGYEACVPPAEVCDGEDQDCVDGADDAFDCVQGTTGIACTTTCDSAGTATCSNTCSMSACIPPTEVCNGLDDDCVMLADNGFPITGVDQDIANHTNPRVATDGTTAMTLTTFVGGQLIVQPFTAAGVGGTTRFVDAAEGEPPFFYDIVWTGTNYIAAWSTLAGGDFIRLIGADGVPQGAAIPLSAMATESIIAIAASSGAVHLFTNLTARRFSAAGTQLSSASHTFGSPAAAVGTSTGAIVFAAGESFTHSAAGVVGPFNVTENGFAPRSAATDGAVIVVAGNVGTTSKVIAVDATGAPTGATWSRAFASTQRPAVASTTAGLAMLVEDSLIRLSPTLGEVAEFDAFTIDGVNRGKTITQIGTTLYQTSQEPTSYVQRSTGLLGCDAP